MDGHRPAVDPGNANVELDRAWRDHRRHLLDIGFRMLGNLSAAEDVVQEAFIRLARADLDHIDDVGGWLVVVVSRLCLDTLRSARRHPTLSESLLGERPTDPALDPAHRVTLDDSIRLALQVVLERLTPAERTAFVLRHFEGMPVEEIGKTLGIQVNAAKHTIFRAVRKLRESLEPFVRSSTCNT